MTSVLLPQVTGLRLEELVNSDPSRLVLTSQSPGGSDERFILLALSPAIGRAWRHQINLMLENQRNFLNGKSPTLPSLCVCVCVYQGFVR